MGKFVDRAARAEQVVTAALELYLERPRDGVTFELLAERSGLKFWQIYHFHGNTKNLFRAAAQRLIQRIESDLAAMPSDAASVSRASRIYTAFAAQVMQQEPYAQFLYLLIRDRCAEPMLDEAYEQRIAKVLRSGLERIIGNAGQRHDLIVLLSPAATLEFVKSLEAELVLPKLLPGYSPPGPEAVSEIIKRIADRTVTATYALEPRAA